LLINAYPKEYLLPGNFSCYEGEPPGLSIGGIGVVTDPDMILAKIW
jgi:hypothetical protein